MPFFHFLFSLKIWLKIRFNNVQDTKEPIFDYKRKISKSPKNRIFLKGLTHAFGQKCQFFLYVALVTTRLELRFNNVLERKENFLTTKNKIFPSPKSCIFPKGLTHAIGQKMPILSFFGFG